MRIALAILLLAATAVQAEEFRMPPLESFGEVTARPLFAPDRRPREALPQSTGPAAPVVLAGIVIAAGNRYALLNEGAPVLRRVAEGERLPAGIVKQILPDRILLATSGGEAVVTLFDKKPAANSTPAEAVQGPPSRMLGN